MRQFIRFLAVLTPPSALALFVAGVLGGSRRLVGLAAGLAAGLTLLLALTAGKETVREFPPTSPP